MTTRANGSMDAPGTREYFVDVASDYGSDFVVFPELFTMSLLSYETDTLSPMQAIERMTEHRTAVVGELSRMALRNASVRLVGRPCASAMDPGSRPG